VAVFGVPDEYYDEEVMSWLKLHAGETATEHEIRDFCRDNLSHFKIPRYIWFVKDFPMTVTGKLQKFRMQKKIAIEKMSR
jgi:fatty-acyl-CoA synthase